MTFKLYSPIVAALVFVLLACGNSPQVKTERHLFFLHNRFLETHSLDEAHPRYGKVAYQAILKSFEQASLNVWSEKRQGNTNTQDYARQVVLQIEQLIAKGTPANHITVVGTSKGGYIAQYVSTFLGNPDVNFVFIACFQDSDIENFPEIIFHGNILTIYESSDPFGVSASRRKETNGHQIKHFKEIELHTGLQHGFIFKALPEWLKPTIKWAKGGYKDE